MNRRSIMILFFVALLLGMTSTAMFAEDGKAHAEFTYRCFNIILLAVLVCDSYLRRDR